MNIFGEIGQIILLTALFVSTFSAFEGENFSVNLTNCIERIGVRLVPTKKAGALTPAGFILAGKGHPVTPQT